MVKERYREINKNASNKSSLEVKDLLNNIAGLSSFRILKWAYGAPGWFPTTEEYLYL